MESAIIECLKGIAPTRDNKPLVYFNDTNSKTMVALAKKDEVYVFIYDDESRKEALLTLGRFASRETSPELSFTWYDAAIVSQKMRQQETVCKPGNYSNISYSEMKRRRFELDDCFD